MPGVPGPQTGPRPSQAAPASRIAAAPTGPSTSGNARSRMPRRNARFGRLDGLAGRPAEPQLRPCREVGRPLAETQPGTLSHQSPDPDPFLREPARSVQLGKAEEVAELVTEDAEVAERRDLLFSD